MNLILWGEFQINLVFSSYVFLIMLAWALKKIIVFFNRFFHLRILSNDQNLLEVVCCLLEGSLWRCLMVLWWPPDQANCVLQRFGLRQTLPPQEIPALTSTTGHMCGIYFNFHLLLIQPRNVNNLKRNIPKIRFGRGLESVQISLPEHVGQTRQKSVFVTISSLSNVSDLANPSRSTLIDAEGKLLGSSSIMLLCRKQLWVSVHSSNIKQQWEEQMDSPLALWMLSDPFTRN